jgi:hypothetical protein
MPDHALLSDLCRALACHDLNLDSLRRDAQAIVLFGSRAAGCAELNSDWDLLCVGAGSSRRTYGLDVVWVEPRALQTSAWLGSDLASHIAAHGLWLEGKPSWDLSTVDFSKAAFRKEARLARSLRSLSRAWNLLRPEYQAKHANLIRRDVQRFNLLRCRLPIPPSAMLDALWGGEQQCDWLADALLNLDAQPHLAQTLSKCAEEVNSRIQTAVTCSSPGDHVLGEPHRPGRRTPSTSASSSDAGATRLVCAEDRPVCGGR